jgi:hypothetical protein
MVVQGRRIAQFGKGTQRCVPSKYNKSLAAEHCDKTLGNFNDAEHMTSMTIQH